MKIRQSKVIRHTTRCFPYKALSPKPREFVTRIYYYMSRKVITLTLEGTQFTQKVVWYEGSSHLDIMNNIK